MTLPGPPSDPSYWRPPGRNPKHRPARYVVIPGKDGEESSAPIPLRSTAEWYQREVAPEGALLLDRRTGHYYDVAGERVYAPPKKRPR